METATAEHKQQTRRQWNQTPCGEVAGNKDSEQYFLDVETYRYHDASWMPGCFGYDQFGGKKVLEIGFGQGTDLCQFAKAGAECYGVDITETHFRLATANFEKRGLEAQLRLCDAKCLPYDDDTFDAVYSFGVLHHTPDTNRCIAEAHRVLKPGGRLLLGMYHRRSFFHYVYKLGFEGLVRGKLFRLGYAGLLATIEKGADGVHIKPLVKLYTKGQLAIMLADFSTVSLEIQHLPRKSLPVLEKCLPNFVMDMLAARWGWYVVAKAVK